MRLSHVKKLAPVVILFFVLSSITAPARAVLPLIAEGVMLIAEGGTAANALAALTVGTVAGVIYLGGQSTGAGSRSGSIMEIPLGTSRDRPLPVPAGYSPPVNNDSQPIPPGSVTPTISYSIVYNSITYNSTTPQGACQAFSAIYNANFIYDHVESFGTAGNYNCYEKYTPTGSVSNTALISLVNSCPAGYSLNGASCALTTASLVMKPADGRCDVLIGVPGFTIDPNDPECSGLATNTGTTVTPTKISSRTPGSTTSTDITINADGTRTLTSTRANADGKTSTITNITFTPAAGGQNAIVSGTSVTVVNGVGTGAGTSPLPAAPSIQFPDDYNREVTQNQIKLDLDAMKAEADTSGWSPPAAAAKTPAEMAADENKKITDELNLSVQSYDNFKLLDWSTWVPVFPTGSCTPISGSVMGKTITWDLCPKIALLNETIGWLLSVFAAWSVVNLMFRKEG